MPEFGKRTRHPIGPSTNPIQPVRRTRRDEPAEPKSGGRKLLKAALIGMVGGLALFGAVEIGATTFLKAQMAQILQQKTGVPFLNRDMVTGVHHRKERLSWVEEEAHMAPAQRHAWETADQAIKSCFQSLQDDRDDRQRAGQIDRSYYAKFSYEPALRDLGFYLPCLMDEGRSRFCQHDLKQDLVLRLNGYFGMLSVAKRNREHGPQVVANPQNDPFEQVKRTLIEKEFRETPTPMPMSFTTDERITNSMRKLVNLGYLSINDFASFLGFFVPNHISAILADANKELDSCQG